MDYKIQSSTLYTCDKYGNSTRRICDSVSYANYSEKDNIFVITRLDGTVETKDVYGNSIRRICDSAIEAKFQDGNILVRFKNENKLIDEYGNVIRRI